MKCASPDFRKSSGLYPRHNEGYEGRFSAPYVQIVPISQEEALGRTSMESILFYSDGVRSYGMPNQEVYSRSEGAR